MSMYAPKPMNATGHCGRNLVTKEWKAGTKVECEFIGTGVVSYPNRGILHHINRFCGPCRHSGDKTQ